MNLITLLSQDDVLNYMQYKVQYCFDFTDLPKALTSQMNEMARTGWKVVAVNSSDFKRAMVTYEKE